MAVIIASKGRKDAVFEKLPLHHNPNNPEFTETFYKRPKTRWDDLTLRGECHRYTKLKRHVALIGEKTRD